MIEIDVLPASHTKKSGDAILIRTGTFSYDSPKNNKQTVILIDSGYADTADTIEEYLSKYYKTDTIDIAFITHPDGDHIGGLKELLDRGTITIKSAHILDPWKHLKEVYKKTKDGRVTPNSINARLKKSMEPLAEVLDKLGKKNSEIFFGSYYNCGYRLYVLGPTEEYYETLLNEYPGMPNERIVSQTKIYEDSETAYDENFKHFLKNPETSARNDSSLIICICDGNNKPIALFTGDAGVESIECALENAEKIPLDLSGIKLFQLPHHGSLKNISEDIIDCIAPKKVFVSASDDGEHPSRLLVNYLLEKGICYRYIGSSKGIRFPFDGAPDRQGWNSVKDATPYAKVRKLKAGVGK